MSVGTTELLIFLGIGLVAGWLAGLVLGGGGLLRNLIVGVIGALLGGWIGGMVASVDMNDFFSLASWIWAIIGALIVLVIWGFITNRRSSTV